MSVFSWIRLAKDWVRLVRLSRLEALSVEDNLVCTSIFQTFFPNPNPNEDPETCFESIILTHLVFNSLSVSKRNN